MSAQELIATAKAMVAEGKGLLAMDESTSTCNKRFEKLGILQTEETRRSYRDGRSFCQVACGDYHRRWHSQSGLYRGQRAGVGSLCRVVPGSRLGPWSPLSSRKCSWTASIPWGGAWK
jgi:hypothetical protein